MGRKEYVTLGIIYLVISLLVYGFSLIQKNRFSTERLNQLISSNGKSKQLTPDPCAFSIAGDPDAGNNFIRLIIICKNGKSTNTLDANAVKGGSLESLLSEFQRINGVSAEIRKYECKKDSAPITLSSQLNAPTTVECTYEK